MQDKESARRKISSSKSDAGLQEQQRAPNSNRKKLDTVYVILNCTTQNQIYFPK